MVRSDPPIPDVALLETALGLLAPDIDAEEIGAGADDARRQAGLLAHLAAWSLFMHDTVAQRDAAMNVHDVADLHARADRSVAQVIANPEVRDPAVLHLQILRLIWVHHALLALRARAPEEVVDAALASIAGVVDLLAAVQLATGASANGAGPDPLRRAEALLGRAHQLLAERAADD